VNASEAVPRLSSINRSQILLRSVDVEALIEEDHSARSIWNLVGRLELSPYYVEIAAVEGRAGRSHTAPQLLISLWLYAYSRGISSAREVARRCEFEPAFQWLCGLEPVSHKTLSDFRSNHKAALDDLFVQVLGMLSAEGLITMERVTLDGTKIKANAGGNTFRRKEKLQAHLALAQEQVKRLNEEAASEEKTAKRQAAARRHAARQRASRLEAAVREVQRLQQEKKHDREDFVARASSTDPEAHVMRNGEGGTVPSYNVQLVTDTAHGLIVNVKQRPMPSTIANWSLLFDAARKLWGVSHSSLWPTAITRTTLPYRRRLLAEWISMLHGKTAGGQLNTTRRAVTVLFLRAHFRMTPIRIASSAPPDNC